MVRAKAQTEKTWQVIGGREGVGVVGEASEELEALGPMFRLIDEYRWTWRQVDEMTLEEIYLCISRIDMRQDIMLVYQQYHEDQMNQENK